MTIAAILIGLCDAGVRAGILEQQAAIRSFRVEYDVKSRLPDSSRKPFLHAEIAVKRPYSLLLYHSHGRSGADYNDDRWARQVFVTKDEIFTEFPLSLSFLRESINPQDGLPKLTEKLFYLLATGIWPLDSRKPPSHGYPPALIDVARDLEYSLRKDAEIVDGHQCYVLEKKRRDVLWLDPARGCCLLARELYDDRTGALVQRFELNNHKLFSDGIWLPLTIQSQVFDSAARSTERRRKAVIDGLAEVRVLNVNDLPDDAFQFEPAPGSVEILDYEKRGLAKTSLRQARPGGQEHLDQLAEWIIRTGRGPKHLAT